MPRKIINKTLFELALLQRLSDLNVISETSPTRERHKRVQTHRGPIERHQNRLAHAEKRGRAGAGAGTRDGDGDRGWGGGRGRAGHGARDGDGTGAGTGAGAGDGAGDGDGDERRGR